MVKVSQSRDFSFEVAYVFLKFGGVGIVRDKFLDDDQLVIGTFVGCQQSCSHTAFTKHPGNDITTTLQRCTNGQRMRCAACGRAGSCRTQGSATITAIAHAIAVFIFTVGTFHCSYLLSPILGYDRFLEQTTARAALMADYTLFLLESREHFRKCIHQ